MPNPSLLQRLKERKLVQWAIAYIAGAFVIVQALDALETALGLTANIQRSILVVVVIGFFITLVLAWYHGEKGRQRVSGPELLMVAALLVVAGVSLIFLGGRSDIDLHRLDRGEGDRPFIAVLPFENFSPDPGDAYFADGMQEQIISALGKVSALGVISRSSVMQYRGTRPPVPQIAEEIGADYLLEGSARIAGGMVRLTAQLIDGARDEHIWTEDYDRPYSVENLIEIHADLAENIAEELQAALLPEEAQRIADVPTQDSVAYQLFLRARILWWTRGLDALEQAVELFQAAIAEDAGFGLAYAGLAETYAVLPEMGGPTFSEVLPLGREAVETALSLDPNLAEAHNASGYLNAAFEWEWEEAERDYRRAIELNPGYATAHQWYAELLGVLGRWEEAFSEIERAIELDPRSPAANVIMGYLQHFSGQPSEAIQWFERSLAIAPDFPPPCWGLGHAFTAMGDLESAASWYATAAEVTGSDPEFERSLIAALSDSSMIPEAVRVLRAPPTTDGNYNRAHYLAHLGQTEEALEALEEALEAHIPFLPWINVNPDFDGIRSEPRFQALLRRMNLGS
jgi:TolB-like protein